MPCYDTEIHPDADAEINALRQNGASVSLAKLVAVLVGVVQHCLPRSEQVIFTDAHGVQFFKRDCAGLTAIFVIQTNSQAPRSTLHILAVDSGVGPALAVATIRA